MDIKEIKATLNINLIYGKFLINISNTHNKRILFRLSENNGKGWVEIPTIASEYILNDFKKTEEFKKIDLIFNNLLKEYSY